MLWPHTVGLCFECVGSEEGTRVLCAVQVLGMWVCIVALLAHAHMPENSL